jgi:hypothetical protein
VPASSAASERLFSAAGRVLEKRRQSLSPRNVDAILFLRSRLGAETEHDNELASEQIAEEPAALAPGDSGPTEERNNETPDSAEPSSQSQDWLHDEDCVSKRSLADSGCCDNT